MSTFERRFGGRSSFSDEVWLTFSCPARFIGAIYAAMLKGSDANLLCHVIELAAMRALVRRAAGKHLHFYGSHAKAPWDELDDSVGRAARARLNRALHLAKAQKGPLPSGTKLQTSPVIDAYARLDASESSFPNSAMLLRSACLHEGVTLTGVLVDKDKRVESLLREQFPSFRVFCGDWRVPMVRYRPCEIPWLFSIDPGPAPTKSAVALSPADIRLVGEHVDKHLMTTKQLGVVAMLCHGLDDDACGVFWNASVDALGGHGLEFLSLDAGSGGRRHVAAVMATDDDVLAQIVAEVRGSIEGIAGL